MSLTLLEFWDSLVAILQDGGLSNELAHHAVHLLGARLFGITQEVFDEKRMQSKRAAALFRDVDLTRYPALMRTAAGGLRHDDEVEFAFGLDLILDGIERART